MSFDEVDLCIIGCIYSFQAYSLPNASKIPQYGRGWVS